MSAPCRPARCRWTVGDTEEVGHLSDGRSHLGHVIRPVPNLPHDRRHAFVIGLAFTREPTAIGGGTTVMVPGFVRDDERQRLKFDGQVADKAALDVYPALPRSWLHPG